jgi:hypothetical protein
VTSEYKSPTNEGKQGKLKPIILPSSSVSKQVHQPQKYNLIDEAMTPAVSCQSEFWLLA